MCLPPGDDEHARRQQWDKDYMPRCGVEQAYSLCLQNMAGFRDNEHIANKGRD